MAEIIRGPLGALLVKLALRGRHTQEAPIVDESCVDTEASPVEAALTPAREEQVANYIEHVIRSSIRKGNVIVDLPQA